MTLLCSQVSAWARLPLCASSSTLGAMNEYCGNAWLARSVANCVKGTMLAV